MEKVSSFLLQHNIRPSSQRVRIYHYLYNNKNHPSADQIYLALNPEIPTLSKTTVYNTLKLFTEKGIVKKVQIEDHEVRFDADTIPHGHFKCIGCGNLFDFPINLKLSEEARLSGFKITEEHFYLKGFCKLCKAN